MRSSIKSFILRSIISNDPKTIKLNSASLANKFQAGGGKVENLLDLSSRLVDEEGEEEEDDLVFECPGLAPHGEMEVNNPFFLNGELCLASQPPRPLGSSIVRNTKPGQQ